MGRLRWPAEGFARPVLAVLGCVALGVMVWALAYERIGYERSEALAEAGRRNANLTLAFEQHVIASLKYVDQSLLLLKEHYEENRPASLVQISRSGLLDENVFTAAFIVDRDGRAVWPDAIRRGGESFARREWFQYHRDHADSGVLISRPLVGQFSRRPTIPLTRRLVGRDGRFGGVAVVGMSTEYFMRFFQDLDVGRDGMVQIAGLDGYVRTGRTGTRSTHGDDIRESALLRLARASSTGSFTARDEPDGVVRAMSYRQVREFPLLVAVGTSVDETLSAFRPQVRRYVVAASAISALLAVLGIVIALLLWRQQRAQAEEKRRRRQYRATFEQAAIGMAHVDLEGRFTKVNRKLCAMLGYAEEELLALRLADLDRNGAPIDVPELLSRSQCERCLATKEGATVWIALTLSLVRDVAGEPAYCVALIEDITRRKEADALLRESEERFRRTFELARMGVAHIGLDRRFIRVNRRLCEILGYPEDELVGLTGRQISHPEDLDVINSQRPRLYAGEIPHVRVEKRYLRKDGGVVWVSFSMVVERDAAGTPLYEIAIFDDITERKRAEALLAESERRFRDMLGSVQLVSLMLDRDARITYCNDHLLQIAGWSREQVLGRDWFELFIPGECGDVRKYFAELLAGEASAGHHENEIVTRGGERRLVRWNNTVLRSVSGEVVGTASLGEDITHRRAAERRLLEQLDELRRFQRVTVDRELRMLDLERELKRLKEQVAA